MTSVLKTKNVNKNSFGYKLKKDLINNRGLYGLILPGFILLIIFTFVPMYGIIMAFKEDIIGVDIMESPWYGFQNFIDAFENPFFMEAFKNTILISLFTMVVSFIFPLIFALALNNLENLRYKKIVQLISYAPYFISVTVLVLILNIFFRQEEGLLNNFLHLFGGGLKSDPTTSPEAFYSLFVWSGLWQTLGWNSIIYVSALSSVNPELYEAATLEGATKLQKIRFIEIPWILPTIVTLLILSAGGILGVGFEKAYLMANEGNASSSSVISTFVYEHGLASNQYGFGTAVGLFNSVVSFLVLLGVNFLSKRLTKYSIM